MFGLGRREGGKGSGNWRGTGERRRLTKVRVWVTPMA